MPILRLRIGLILYGIGLILVTLLNLFFPASSVLPEGFGFRLTHSFERVFLNNRVLVAPAFQLIPGESAASLKKRIRQTYKPNLHPYLVTHGHSSNVPTGWIYTELTNPTATPSEVVLSFLPHRCGRATLFLVRPKSLDSVATLRQNTPLSQRFFTTYQYALPFTVPPGQTIGVLLRTNTYMGYNEVDLTLSSRTTFTEQLLVNNMMELLVIFSCLVIGLTALVVGIATPSRFMRIFGCMMLVIMLQVAAFYGYLSGLPYPDFMSFNSSNIISCCWFMLIVTSQLFLYEVFKPAVQTVRWYKPGVYTLIGISLVGVLLHLLPPQVYSYLNVPINRTLMVTTYVGLCFLGYFSFVAYRRAGIAYMGLFLLVFLGDMVVRKLVEFLINQNSSLLKFPSPAHNPLLFIGLLTYLTVMQFRREHISKRRMGQQLRQNQERINALRREEIERIGRDLHDQVGNTLAAAIGYLSRPQAEATQKSLLLIRTAITELRFLSHNLIKDNDRSLTDKVETLVGRFNDFSDIRFVFKDYSENKADELTSLQQQSVYHIVQELFTNIVRHSGASRVYVQFFGDNKTLEVTVEDDGTGFDLSTARANGVGIQNIFKRAELAQITLCFDPAPTGTSVHLTVHHEETLPNHPYRRPPAV
jgi:signal transduction histidine kinase